MAKAHVIPGKGMIRGKPNPRHQTIGERLKMAREAADIKPVHLSLAAGLSIDTCLRIEDQGRSPGVDTLERLARVLRVSPGWLAFAPLRAPIAPAPPVEEGAPLACEGMAERLQALRTDRGLSRNALGQLVGISHTTMGNIEAGRTFPGVDTTEQLAKGLGVSPAWLAYGEGPQVLPKVPRRRKVVKDGPPRRAAAVKGRAAKRGAPAARRAPAKGTSTRTKGAGPGPAKRTRPKGPNL